MAESESFSEIRRRVARLPFAFDVKHGTSLVFDRAGVADMAEAREQRVFMQRRLIRRTGNPVISFMLNIPGALKNSSPLHWAFNHATVKILKTLSDNALSPESVCISNTFTGAVLLISIDADPLYLKQIACKIEDADRFGRLCDIDILRPDGRKVSRTGIGLSPRRCLICNHRAQLCARSRTHSVAELQREIHAIILSSMNRFLGGTHGNNGAIFDSLMEEVCTTPKPGLVDMHDNGAHDDMDVAIFEASSRAIAPFLLKMFSAGAAFCGSAGELPALFELVRKTGMCAEKAMFEATLGVNTHKGMIFSMGLLLTSFGLLMNRPAEFDSVFRNIIQMTSSVLTSELKSLSHADPVTHGEHIWQKYNIGGARGEALNGLPTLQSVLPGYVENLKNYSAEKVNIDALMRIIPILDDCNVIARGSITERDSLRALIRNALEKGSSFTSDGMEYITRINKWCIDRHISPGGSADILALCVMTRRFMQGL